MTPPPPQGLPTLELRELEGMAIKEALAQSNGHIADAAKVLGIGRATLYRRVVQIGVADAPAPPSSGPSRDDETE